jgi:hypothetical protein
MFFRVVVSDLARYEALEEAQEHRERARAVRQPSARARETRTAQSLESRAAQCPATIGVFLGNNTYVLGTGGLQLAGFRGRGSAELPLLTPELNVAELQHAMIHIAIDPGTEFRRVTFELEESDGSRVPICDGDFHFEYAGHVPPHNEFVFLSGTLEDHMVSVSS